MLALLSAKTVLYMRLLVTDTGCCNNTKSNAPQCCSRLFSLHGICKEAPETAANSPNNLGPWQLLHCMPGNVNSTVLPGGFLNRVCPAAL